MIPVNGTMGVPKEVKMNKWEVEEQVEESIKAGLARFRKEARVIFGRPVLTKRGIACCGGCASAELTCAWEADERGDKRAIGAVFYSRQGAADYRNGGDLSFSYGAFEAQGYCSRDTMTNRIGDLLAESLRREGCEVEWNGKNSDCVTVSGVRSVMQSQSLTNA
jgi:hypothetical protein